MCLYPIKQFPIGLTENGKTKYARCHYDINHVEISPSGAWVAVKQEARAHDASYKVVRDWIGVGCNQCAECKMAKSREWANRLMMEKLYHEHAYFLTLTYNEEHAPRRYPVDPATGEILDLRSPVLSLNFDDVQKWLKRLRKAFSKLSDTKVRYYLCGEYGAKTFRPHYHVIMFSPEIPDLKLYAQSWNKDLYYTSDFIDRTWSDRNGKIGHVIIAEVTWESAAYVARYLIKKNTPEKRELIERAGIEKEDSRSSNRPGIAACYFFDHPDLFENDYINISAGNKGIKFRPPAYFKKLYEKDHPEGVPNKERGLAMAKHRLEHLLDKTTQSFDEYAETRARNFDDTLKKLIRSLDDA